MLSTAMAQNIEDALRYAQSNMNISPRSAGLGVAFYGVSDDFSALFYNPAGLALIQKNELSIGFGFTTNKTSTDYSKGNTITNLLPYGANNLTVNSEFPTHAGLSMPFKIPTGYGSIAIGYSMESNFKNDLTAQSFNKTSTLIDYYTTNGTKDISSNLGTFLWLANDKYVTPIKNNLEQRFDITETGGLHNFTGGAGFDLSETVSMGFSITGKFGTYDYTKLYYETDVNNLYQVRDDVNFTNVDFQQLKLKETVSQEVSGITGSLGIMAKIKDIMRLSATVKFPTYYQIDETFASEATAYFDDGTYTLDPWKTSGKSSYKIRTPFKYSAGASVHALGLTFAAGVEYSDVSQMEFSDASEQVEDQNLIISRELIGQTTWGFGAEYEIPLFDAIVRASYSSTTSPYAQDIAGASIKYFALGGGFYVAPNVRLDGVFRWSDQSILRTNYGDTQFTYTTKPFTVGFQITYRY
jgi:hypothetical protein